MPDKIIFCEPHITISYDLANGYLIANWTGDQSKQSVMNGCEKILNALQQEQCNKVLNDNSNVTSIWSDASDWVASDWFPRMNEAGCDFFAWVYSPNFYSKLSTDQTLKHDIRNVMTITFNSVETAASWLKAV